MLPLAVHSMVADPASLERGTRSAGMSSLTMELCQLSLVGTNRPTVMSRNRWDLTIKEGIVVVVAGHSNYNRLSFRSTTESSVC